MNNEYLCTNEKSRQIISSNLSHNKRYSTNITDYNIYKRNDITKINKQDKFYINHAIIHTRRQTKLSNNSNNNYLDNIIKNRNINLIVILYPKISKVLRKEMILIIGI